MALTKSQLIAFGANWNFKPLPFGKGNLRTAFYGATGPLRGNILMFLGRGEFIELMTEDASRWSRAGYNVLSFDFPGQGASGRLLPDIRKCHIDTFERYLDATELVNREMWQPLLQTAPGLMQGHSTGAHVALRYMAHNPNSARGLIAMSPMIGLPLGEGPARVFAELAVETMGLFRSTAYGLKQDTSPPAYRPFNNNRHTTDITRFNQWQLLRRLNPNYVTGGATAGWVRAALHSCRALQNELRHYHVPTLGLLTPDDVVVDPKAMLQVPYTKKVLFYGQKHVLAQAPDAVQEQVWRHKTAFAARVCAGINAPS